MSDWRVMSVDGGVVTYFRDNNGKHEWKTSEDVSTLLDATQRARSNETGNWKGDMHHYASVPITLWMQWTQECGGDPGAKENQAFLKKKLNDLDYSKLRTKTGRV